MEDKSLEELEDEFDSLPIMGPPTDEALKSQQREGTKNYHPQN